MNPTHPMLVVSHGGTIYGLAMSDGTIRWQTKVSDYDMVDTLEIVVAGDTVLACTSAGQSQLWCLRHETGEIIGCVELGFKRGGRARMMLTGDRIVVNRQGEVITLDLTGQLLWRQVFELKTGGTSMAVSGQSVQADLVK